MPQFQLNHGNEDGSRKLSDMDEFTHGYVEAMFFTETGDAADEYPDATVADISDEGWQEIIADCARFQLENAEMLGKAYEDYAYEAEQAGRDFWLTRNGHGVGFWDRGLDITGEALSEAARSFGEAHIDNFLGTSAPHP